MDASQIIENALPQESRLDLREKKDLVTWLNRIEGQVYGVQGQVERNEYCDQILIQIAAIHSALNGVGKLMFANHLKSCVVRRVQQGDETIVDEMLQTMKTLMK
jgi:DNA-binding FrmR family transcriptional regulator